MAGFITDLDSLIVTPTLPSIRKDLGGDLARKRVSSARLTFPTLVRRRTVSTAAVRRSTIHGNGRPLARPACRVLPAEHFPTYCITIVM